MVAQKEQLQMQRQNSVFLKGYDNLGNVMYRRAWWNQCGMSCFRQAQKRRVANKTLCFLMVQYDKVRCGATTYQLHITHDILWISAVGYVIMYDNMVGRKGR